MDVAQLARLAWALPLLLILLAAWRGFHQPPTNRSSTTFALFYFGMLSYLALLISIWGFVIIGLVEAGELLALEKLNISESLVTVITAVIAAMMVVLSKRFKTVQKLDTTARQFCRDLAIIPRVADQLGMELASHADYRLNETLKTRVRQLISNNIGSKAVNFENDGSLSSRFTRAVSLYWLFVAPHLNGSPFAFPTESRRKSHYVRLMQFQQRTVSQASGHYQKLMRNGLKYFTEKEPGQQQQQEDNVRKIANETCNFVCGLIARYVLALGKTSSVRREELSRIGFGGYSDVPPYGVNEWTASVFTTVIITLIVVLLTPRAEEISFGKALFQSFVFALQIGLAILAATFVALRFIRRDLGAGALPPLFELTWAGLIVVAMSGALKITAAFVLVFVTTRRFELQASVDAFLDRWPGVLFPLGSTFSIGLLCIYLTRVKWSWLKLVTVGAIANGLAFTLIALIVALLLAPEALHNFHADLGIAKFRIVLASSAVGLAVGAVVIAMFTKSLATVSPPVTTRDDDEWEDRPLEEGGGWAMAAFGGYARANVQELEGRYICFRRSFVNPSIINAYLISIGWDLEQSCLMFEETERPDIAHTQRGPVCVPDGKPFINLLTMEKGDMRLITVSRPNKVGLAYGLVLTLSNPNGVVFIPASAPIVLRKLDEKTPTPHVGFVHPGTADYEWYQEQLQKVSPNYGVLVDKPVSPAH
jgi:hypothetical protein